MIGMDIQRTSKGVKGVDYHKSSKTSSSLLYKNIFK